MITTVGELMNILQGIDPKIEVYFGSSNEETLDLETVPITKIERGFVTHKSGRFEFSDIPPTERMNINYPAWVVSAIRIV